jgi:serine/threonine-protein kinase
MTAALTAAARARAPLRGADTAGQTQRPQIGGWELTRQVGEGGYSRSFRAKPVDDAKVGWGDFVVKVARTDGVDAAFARAILRREAVVSRLVPHENLASVLVDRASAPRPHLVLPYGECVTGEQLLATCIVDAHDQEHLLPLATACSIVRQIALAAEALHARGWIHSGIGLASLTIARSGHATLGELGKARRINTDECLASSSLTDVGRLPPEVLVAHGRWSPASDVYCLGLLLFELAAGRMPFLADNAEFLARLHREQAPPDLREIRPSASRELAELVRRMLAKEPLRRPDAQTVARWLAEIEIAELPSSVDPRME